MGSPQRRPMPGPARAAAPSADPQVPAAQRAGVQPVEAHPAGAQSAGAQPAAPAAEPRFDPSSWLGAIILMTVFTAAVWVVQIVNAENHYSFNRFGLRARTVAGLWGVLASPFLHSTYGDMVSDTLPLLLIGWVLLLAGVRIWLAVTAVCVVVGGFLTWLIAPSDLLIVGSSSLVFGWMGYLVARALFSRKLRWIIVAVMVLLIFGALLAQLAPVAHSHQTWQEHVAGFVAGAAIGAALHSRRRRPSRPRGPEAAAR